MPSILNRPFGASLIASAVLFCVTAWAQLAVPTAPPVPVSPPVAQDALGRTSPRGAVFGFLAAARKGENETAAQYLNTRLRGNAAASLAHQLFVVLDRRLPAQLNQLSDRPEGSMRNLAKPNLDRVGAIQSSSGETDIVLERLERGKAGSLWFFSGDTLDAIPDLYDEVNTVPIESIVPAFLTNTRIARLPLFAWLALLVGAPLLYWLIVLLNRAVNAVFGHLRRRVRKNPDLPDRKLLPIPVRLLFMVGIMRWTLSKISLPLLARQFWSNAAGVTTIVACVWLAMLLNKWSADYIHGRLRQRGATGAVSILRLAEWMADLLVIFGGVLAGFSYFGVKPTAALAGLGVGGIAIALAAQKTLENVIGGVSIIFDHVVDVGESLKVGNTLGTVQAIGLRSTRIRTLDRTVVSVPNGQIANASLENLSQRDKFWFKHELGLRYETTALQMRDVLQGVSDLLEQHTRVDRESVRVQLIRLGECSLDIEIFAYFFARDWNHFLGIQGELLVQIMEVVQTAGARMALKSQTLYVDTASSSNDRTTVRDFVKTHPPAKKAAEQREIQYDGRTDALTRSPR